LDPELKGPRVQPWTQGSKGQLRYIVYRSVGYNNFNNNNNNDNKLYTLIITFKRRYIMTIMTKYPYFFFNQGALLDLIYCITLEICSIFILNKGLGLHRGLIIICNMYHKFIHIYLGNYIYNFIYSYYINYKKIIFNYLFNKYGYIIVNFFLNLNFFFNVI